MTPEQLEAHRVRFEQKYRERNGLGLKLARFLAADYVSPTVEVAWQAYQWAIADADRTQRAAPGVQSRIAFEDFWIRTMNTAEMDLHRFADGYSCHETNRAWLTWQAAQPPQQSAQPVAKVVQMNQSRYFSCLATSETTIPQIGAKLYAAPQPVEVQRVPMTDAEVETLIKANHFSKNYRLKESDRTILAWYRLGLRDGERTHGIKPTSNEGGA